PIAAPLREKSQRLLPHFERLQELSASGILHAIDLDPEELATYARLRDPEYVRQFSPAAGLGRGEAAALAVALSRGWELLTDDGDAVKVAAALAPNVNVSRIRGLLVEASNSGAISRERARE